jgi:hypothetical protein
MATLPAQTRRFKLRISAILCKNSSDLFLDTKGLLRLKSMTGPAQGAPGLGHDLFQRLATREGHKMWSLPPCSAASFIPLLHFSVQTPFPIPMGDLHQIRVQGHGN